MLYTVTRKFYKSAKDMNPDNPYKVLDVWASQGCYPLTLEEARIVCSKLMTGKLWINQIIPYK